MVLELEWRMSWVVLVEPGSVSDVRGGSMVGLWVSWVVLG